MAFRWLARYGSHEIVSGSIVLFVSLFYFVVVVVAFVFTEIRFYGFRVLVEGELLFFSLSVTEAVRNVVPSSVKGKSLVYPE